MNNKYDIFSIQQGNSPLLLSFPHSGIQVPADILSCLTPEAQGLPDTDWYVPDLYDFHSEKAITSITAHYSRYVVDLNRSPDNKNLYPGKTTTGICPLNLFNGNPIYIDGKQPDKHDIAQRIQLYWQPYHKALMEQIERIKTKHGFCILYDAHSIRSNVPSLFDGQLPDLNLGTNQGRSCDSNLQQLIENFLGTEEKFTWISNGRFIGGYITRRYGDPNNNIHTIQMEIGQKAYLAESKTPVYQDEYAKPLQQLLTRLFDQLIIWQPLG